MRILHMIPDIGVANGILSAILNFAKAMPDEIQFDIVYFHEKDETRAADIEALGGRVFKIDRPAPQDAFGHKYDSFFKAHNGEWSALHIHAPHFAVFIAGSAKRNGIEKICVHCHSSEYSLKHGSAKNHLLSLYAKYSVQDKFACSKLAGEFWYGKKPFTVINNAIDCSKYQFDESIREDVGKTMDLNSSFVVGHVGRTDIPQKNHPFLLAVFAEIVQKKPDAVLLLIGGIETEELLRQCERLGIRNHVQFLGLRNDVSELLQICDVFLFPSTREGLPVSVIEAQAAGLPVLMSDSVTNEVCVTDLVKCLPLSASTQTWANAAISVSGSSRKTMLDEMKTAGWDISSVSKQLTDYYMR